MLGVAIVPNNQIFDAYLVFFGKKLPTTRLVALAAMVSVSFHGLVRVFYR